MPGWRSISEWLNAILRAQSQYWTGNGAHRYVPVMEFADAFEKSAIGRSRTEDLATPFDKASTAGKDPLVYSNYELSSKPPALVLTLPPCDHCSDCKCGKQVD